MPITAHLPEWLATFVDETAEELQVPTDAVALLSLGAVSSAINGGANVVPVPNWSEPVTLYTLALLASGEGKSPVYARLLDPVTAAYEEVTGLKQAIDTRTQKVRNRINKKYIAMVERKCMQKVSAGNMTPEEAVGEIAQAEREIAQFHATNVPLRVLTNTTPAYLMEALADNDGRVVVASPEAESLLNFRGASLDTILNAFDGDTVVSGRKGSGEVTIERPVITMMLAMQPSVLGQIGSAMVNRGLMPRFLIAFPESNVGARLARPRLVSDETSDDYAEHMLGIVQKYSEKGVISIAFEGLAIREIGTWREEIEPLIAPDGLLGSIAAWASKVRGAQFIRLSAMLAIMDGREVVSVADCLNAKAILRSLMIDAKKAFGEMGASFAEDDLVHLMAITAKLSGGTFAKRDIMRRSNRFMAHADQCAAALDKAVEEGLLVKEGKGYSVPELTTGV